MAVNPDICILKPRMQTLHPPGWHCMRLCIDARLWLNLIAVLLSASLTGKQPASIYIAC